MSRVLVSGSLAYDRIMDFDGIFPEPFSPEDMKHLITDFPLARVQETFGGNAGNIAYNLALLDEQAQIIAVAGNDFERYAQWLAKNGIPTSSIQIVSDMPTAHADIVTDTRDNQITDFTEAALGHAYDKEITAGAKLAILSPNHMDMMVSLPQTCKNLEVPYYFDPGQRTTRLSGEELRDALEGAAGLFVNEHENTLVTEKTGWSVNEMLQHVPVVIVTHGEEGADIFSKDGQIRVDAVRVQNAIDPTGAGDAHRAGFIKGILAGFPLRVCGQLASAVASYAVESHGTQNHRFTSAQLKERYERAYGELLTLWL